MPTPATATPAPPTYVGQLGHDLRFPAGLAVVRQGPGRGLWVADTFAGRVHHYDRSGRRRAVIGSGHLEEPRDVAVAGGRVYVADSGRGAVEVFAVDGRHRASFGRGALVEPRGVAVEPPGTVLVSDVGHDRVARFDPASGEIVASVTEGVHVPHGIATDEGGFWLVSSSRQYDGDCGVTRFVADRPTTTLGDGQHSTFGALSNPAHVVAAPDGSVLVSVPDYGFVSRFATDGTFLGELGTEGKGLLRRPLGLALSERGDLLVADSGNRRVATFRGLS